MQTGQQQGIALKIKQNHWDMDKTKIVGIRVERSGYG